MRDIIVEHDTCIALIPARGGSKSVPKKNIRLLQGYPIIAYSIAASKLSQRITRVIVSTDSEEIAEIARRYGAETPFLRPPEYAQDDSPDIDFVRHAVIWLQQHEEKAPEYIVHLRPTTPIRDPQKIDEAIDLIKSDHNATSLRSGYLLAHSPYKWLQKSENGYMRPLISGLTCDEANLPRQCFPEVYVPNGYVDILKTDFIMKNQLLHGERMLGFQTEEVPDIDTEADLYKLDFFKKENGSFEKLQKYLERYI